MTTPDARPPAVSISSVRLAAAWRRLGRSEQLALAGGTAATLGALFELASGGRNANGAGGVAPLILVAALAAVGLGVAARLRPGFAGFLGGSVAGLIRGLALGLAGLAALDLIPVIRYSAELEPFGGVVGAGGRVLALVGAAAVVAGVRPMAGRPRLTLGEGSMIAAGAALMAIGWVLLLAIAEGFAMRAIDGVGLLAACLAATTRLQGATRANPTLAVVRPVLAAVAALLVVDGVIAVTGHLAELIRSGPASLVGLLVYAVGGVLLGVAAARELLRVFRSIRPSTPPRAPVSAA